MNARFARWAAIAPPKYDKTRSRPAHRVDRTRRTRADCKWLMQRAADDGHQERPGRVDGDAGRRLLPADKGFLKHVFGIR